MKNVTQFQPAPSRVETGPIQFGHDWPGVFIRGDHALGYAAAVLDLIERVDLKTLDTCGVLAVEAAKELVKDLQSCRVK